MHRAQGFSLLEVLVAFAMMALVAGVLFQIFGGALRNAGTAGDYSRAALIAESKLAALGVDKPLREGNESGSENEGRFNWQVSVAPFVPPEGASPTDRQSSLNLLPNKLVQADVTVSWEAGDTPRSLTFTTLRLTAKEVNQ